jgi:hypothetical protein
MSAPASSPAPALHTTVTTADSNSKFRQSSPVKSEVCKTTRNAFVVPCAEHGKR